MADFPWTTQQSHAIRSLEDTLLVANAGTGKTTTVVGKILWHLGLGFGREQETGAPLPPPPDICGLEEVAAITFTEKAASDLKKKLRAAVERSERPELSWDVGRASIGTIHSFCAELLREHALRFGVDPTFQILDENEAWVRQDDLIKELVLDRLEGGDSAVRALLAEMRLTKGHFQDGLVDYVRTVMRDLRWHGERYRAWFRGEGGGNGRPLEVGRPVEGDGPVEPDGAAEGHGPTEGGASLTALLGLDLERLRRAAPGWDAADDRAAAVCDTLVGLAEEARTRWRRHEREENVRDFDSLILDLRELLQGADGEPALQGIRRRYRLLVIDEFQDTDSAQRDIAFAIARGVPRPQLFLVGDPKQSIYRFRGADVSVWSTVAEALDRDGQVLSLSRNFRSAPPVVDFVNDAAAGAIEDTGGALEASRPASRVRYDPLEPARPASPVAGVEWLSAEGDSADARRDAESRRIATRILELVGHAEIDDPDDGHRRKLELRDVAILYRTRTGLEHYEAGLNRYGIPYYLAGAFHLKDRQEVLDVLNALRLLRFPRDDLRAFGYLRSPFVGLRDETIGRIRLLGDGGPLLRQAERFLEEGEVWPAPEHAGVPALERGALRRGLEALRELRSLATRIPLDELIEELLERTGYRLHLLLMDRAEESLGNLQSLVHFAEGHRNIGIDRFLEVWDRWARKDLGIPQAPLYSKEDQVVTLTTIHQAKGLEWPVVFFVGLKKGGWKHPANDFWSDHELGPILCPRASELGPWSEKIVEREQLEAEAEEARLLYVATTRARDLLVLVGPRGLAKGYGAWCERAAEEGLIRVPELVREVTPRRLSRPPELSWLDAIRQEDPPALIGRLSEPAFRWGHSATELMLKDRDPDTWERRYRRGVQAPWEFAPEPGDRDGLPATARGTIIHGVLERIRELEELSEVLDEAIGGVDDPHVEQLLQPGSAYRDALEEEIRRVVESEPWRWYVAGEHWRELPFLHLTAPRDWRFGAMDLVRPLAQEDVVGTRREGELVRAGAERDRAAVQRDLFGPVEKRLLVVDFKTHDVDAAGARAAARAYEIQARIYRDAAALNGAAGESIGAAGESNGPGEAKRAAGARRAAAVRLHFTRPNVAIDMP